MVVKVNVGMMKCRNAGMFMICKSFAFGCKFLNFKKNICILINVENKIENVQVEALRIVTGGTKLTSTQKLLKIRVGKNFQLEENKQTGFVK